MELPLQAGSISHGHVHIPSLPVATGPRGHMRTPSLTAWSLGYELPQNNQNGGLQKHCPKASFSTVHRTNPRILLSAACLYLTCVVLRKSSLVSVTDASISRDAGPRTPRIS